MKNELEKKREKVAYEIFTVLSKAMHLSANWAHKYQDFNIFADINFNGKVVLMCQSILATFSQFVHLTVGEFLSKYQSDTKTDDDLKNLRFRYNQLLNKLDPYISEVNKNINEKF